MVDSARILRIEIYDSGLAVLIHASVLKQGKRKMGTLRQCKHEPRASFQRLLWRGTYCKFRRLFIRSSHACPFFICPTEAGTLLYNCQQCHQPWASVGNVIAKLRLLRSDICDEVKACSLSLFLIVPLLPTH